MSHLGRLGGLFYIDFRIFNDYECYFYVGGRKYGPFNIDEAEDYLRQLSAHYNHLNYIPGILDAARAESITIGVDASVLPTIFRNIDNSLKHNIGEDRIMPRDRTLERLMLGEPIAQVFRRGGTPTRYEDKGRSNNSLRRLHAIEADLKLIANSTESSLIKSEILDISRRVAQVRRKVGY